jgi:hypothetical protein
MRTSLALTLLVIGLLACERSRPPDSSGGESAKSAPIGGDITQWTVRPDSFGRLPLGIPLVEANAVLGESLPTESKFSSCANVRSPKMPRGVTLMIERDSVGAPIRVERINIDSAGVRTAEGASVGDTEEHVKQVYGDRLRVEPHKYTGPTGHYLIVQTVGDSLHRIVFETDGQRVLRFRAGRRPAVDYVEGCG